MKVNAGGPGASSSCLLSSRAGVVFALNYWNLRTKHPGGSRSRGSPVRLLQPANEGTLLTF